MIIFITGDSYNEPYWNAVNLNNIRTYDFVLVANSSNSNETGFRMWGVFDECCNDRR
jgi:hypothetical protein